MSSSGRQQVIYAAPPALPSRNSSLASRPPPPPPPVRRTAVISNPNAVTIGTLRSAGVSSVRELHSRSLGRAKSELNVNTTPYGSTGESGNIYSNGHQLMPGGLGAGSGGGMSRSSVHPLTRSEYQNAQELFGQHQQRQKSGGARSAMEGTYGNLMMMDADSHSPAPGHQHPDDSSHVGNFMGSDVSVGQEQSQGGGWNNVGNKLTTIHKQFMETLNEKLATGVVACGVSPVGALPNGGGGGQAPNGLSGSSMMGMMMGSLGGAFDPRMSPKVIKRRSMSLPHSEDDQETYQAGLAGIAASNNYNMNNSSGQYQVPHGAVVPSSQPSGDMYDAALRNTFGVENHYRNVAYSTLRRGSSSSVSSSTDGGHSSSPLGSLSGLTITSGDSGAGSCRSRNREKRHSHSSSIQQSLLNLFTGGGGSSSGTGRHEGTGGGGGGGGGGGTRSLFKGIIGGGGHQSSQTSSDTQSVCTTASYSSSGKGTASGTTTSGRRGSALTISSIDRESLVRILNSKLAQKRQNEIDRRAAASTTTTGMIGSSSATSSPMVGRRNGQTTASNSSSVTSGTITSAGSMSALTNGNPVGGSHHHHNYHGHHQHGHGHQEVDTDTDSGIGHSNSVSSSTNRSSNVSIITSFNVSQNSLQIQSGTTPLAVTEATSRAAQLNCPPSGCSRAFSDSIDSDQNSEQPPVGSHMYKAIPTTTMIVLKRQSKHNQVNLKTRKMSRNFHLRQPFAHGRGRELPSKSRNENYQIENSNSSEHYKREEQKEEEIRSDE